MLNIGRNKQATGKTDGKTENIDEGRNFILPKIPESDLEIIFYHKLYLTIG
jgi:hypothetical protein